MCLNTGVAGQHRDLGKDGAALAFLGGAVGLIVHRDPLSVRPELVRQPPAMACMHFAGNVDNTVARGLLVGRRRQCFDMGKERLDELVQRTFRLLTDDPVFRETVLALEFHHPRVGLAAKDPVRFQVGID